MYIRKVSVNFNWKPTAASQHANKPVPFLFRQQSVRNHFSGISQALEISNNKQFKVFGKC